MSYLLSRQTTSLPRKLRFPLLHERFRLENCGIKFPLCVGLVQMRRGLPCFERLQGDDFVLKLQITNYRLENCGIKFPLPLLPPCLCTRHGAMVTGQGGYKTEPPCPRHHALNLFGRQGYGGRLQIPDWKLAALNLSNP